MGPVRKADYPAIFLCRLFLNFGTLKLLEPYRPVQSGTGLLYL